MSSEESREARRIRHLETDVERLKSAVAELNVLNGIALAASSVRDIDELLDTVVDRSVTALSAEQGAIHLISPDSDNPLQTLVRRKRDAILTDHRLGMQLTGWVLHHRQPLLIPDLATDQRFADSAAAPDIHSVLCVPILFRGDLLGVLTAFNKAAGDTFHSGDQRLLTIIAAQAGQLIHSRRLQAEMLEKQRLEQELAMARQIQMDLLPRRVPDRPGFSFASHLQSADQVGGDYYDFFELDDGHTGIVIADVSGHGPPAALIMTMVKGVLNADRQRTMVTDRVLANLNDLLHAIAPPEIFVTMLVAVLHHASGELRFANAGHNPMIHGRDGDTTPIVVPAPALNLIPGVHYEERTLHMAPGDLVFLYTDGVTEAIDPDGRELGTDGLVDALSGMRGQPAEAVVAHVRQRYADHSGPVRPHDDVAMIAIVRN